MRKGCAKPPKIPIIIVSGRHDEADRRDGARARPPMTTSLKPFSPRELLARVRAVLRRYKNLDRGAARAAMTRGAHIASADGN